MEAFDRKNNEVDITITAPSDNEMNGSDSSDEEEEEEEDILYEDEEDTSSENKDEERFQNAESQAQNTNQTRSANGEETGEELCQDFENNVSLNEEKPSKEEKEKKEQNYEIVGDRVLVERDGKFELVDANEIKAEYFEMLGIKSEGNVEGSEGKDKTDISSEEEAIKARPKTTPARANRSTVRSKRAQSSWGERYKNSEYSKIRSPYGLSEKQLEIKRKREEAIARRKKEEEERSREEEKRKREDAERAFQAWLSSKKEEEKDRRRLALKEQSEEDEKRASESEKAFKAWKAAKKKQQHEEREAATRRMEETASMYVVHDRGSCEEAYKRWLKKKKEDKRAKELDKKKKRRPKLKRKPKEPLPINSGKIRFTDNYGYRNTVVC